MSKKPRIPSSTYRLQLGPHLTLDEACRLVDYLDALGITDCYASPVLQASSRESHGYALINPAVVDPRLGGEEALGRFALRLKQRQMGLVLDIVPNHMFISDDSNLWWRDLLENGPSSCYADYFDIEWEPPRTEMKNQILLPILDDQFGRVLEAGRLQLLRRGGAFYIAYGDRQLPVNSSAYLMVLNLVEALVSQQLQESDSHLLELKSIVTALQHMPSRSSRESQDVEELLREKEIVKQRIEALVHGSQEVARALDEALLQINGRPGNAATFGQLEELLEQQSYRLCFWRVASDEINYRRFFDIDDLACLRIEEPRVFADVHELIFRFVRREWVTGLRVDHVDGLFDPERYLWDLQRGCSISLEGDIQKGTKSIYVLVEKILTGDETLRRNWPVHGTTGYDFLKAVGNLFVCEEHKSAFEELYVRFTGVRADIPELIFRAKQYILQVSMGSELHVLARELDRLAHQHRASRDFTREGLEVALRDIIACFPVYRSYVQVVSGALTEEDRQYITRSIRLAKRRNTPRSRLVFDFIERVLLLEAPEDPSEEQLALRRHFVTRFQQLTGPVMAKGLEDTAFYRYLPLASLNEVGGDPGQFGISAERFHEAMQARHADWPATLSTTSTHDVKRGEDVRARIHVLSEIPQLWAERVNRWHQLNLPVKEWLDGDEVPSRNDEYLFYQTLVGIWPFETQEGISPEFVARLARYMDKATREAKVPTSWVNPNESYDAAVQRFVQRVLDKGRSLPFLEDFEAFVKPIQRAGLWNSLSQLAIKLFAPGVPDFYQGTEGWELTLVDPDNRQPVDFAQSLQALRLLQSGNVPLEELVSSAPDGRLKLYITANGLTFRREAPLLFGQGVYLPLEVSGAKANHVISFARAHSEEGALVAVGRFFLRLDGLVGETVWGDTCVRLPRGVRGGHWKDLLTGQEFEGNGELRICNLFSHLPLALLQWKHGN